ncbi:hypothetical protein C2845_PM03G36010 [Panicum miliaceum]|uniref:Protease Do-like PDZ domain-containing protein n=1 Tax=Panicum miliaceum TaxID=4540 RepID=A0A3L6TGQ1_PANMI|nr:hypothetical protein C2845_PM03G36010 [Panicum miliaceum]
MACVAALLASPALLPFPSTASYTASASCTCRLRLRPAVVARAPRQQPQGRRALRRFDEVRCVSLPVSLACRVPVRSGLPWKVEGVSKKRRGIGGGAGGAAGSHASPPRRDRGLAVDFKESQVAEFEDIEEDKFLNAVVKLKLLAKERYSLATFEEEQIVIVSQVLAHEVNIGYEHMGNQQVIKLNGTAVKNIHHLAHLVDTCLDKFPTFEFEDDFLVVLHREEAAAESSDILKEHAIPSVRSSDLSEPYVETKDEVQKTSEDFGESPVTNFKMGIDGWATGNELSVEAADQRSASIFR